jgi:hypothetical protein
MNTNSAARTFMRLYSRWWFLLVLILAFVAGRLAQPLMKDRGGMSAAKEARFAARGSLTAGDARERGSLGDADRPGLMGAPLERILRRLEKIGTQPSSEMAREELLERLREWGRIDPEGALKHVETLGPLLQDAAFRVVLVEWAKKDPPAAWNWSKVKDPVDARFVDPVLGELGKADADRAWSFASEYARTNPKAANACYSSALLGIAYNGNYAKAADLIEEAELPQTYQDTPGRYDLARVLVSKWSRYDPLQAAAWAQTLPEGSVARERALVEVGQGWGAFEPQDAAAYALAFPESGTRQLMLNQVLASWLADSPAEATEWLGRQGGQHPEFDLAIVHLSTDPNLIRRDPAAAANWANGISDKSLRESTLLQIAGQLKPN